MADTPRTAMQAISESTIVRFKLGTLVVMASAILATVVGGTMAVDKITHSLNRVEERTDSIPDLERRMARIEAALGIDVWRSAPGVSTTPRAPGTQP